MIIGISFVSRELYSTRFKNSFIIQALDRLIAAVGCTDLKMSDYGITRDELQNVDSISLRLFFYFSWSQTVIRNGNNS